LHFGGSDLELIGGPPNSGEYSAIWNTTGIDANKRGARQDLLFVLTVSFAHFRELFALFCHISKTYCLGLKISATCLETPLFIVCIHP
jgi:hypothetical protein